MRRKGARIHAALFGMPRTIDGENVRRMCFGQHRKASGKIAFSSSRESTARRDDLGGGERASAERCGPTPTLFFFSF
jgi:hypothetical protein